MTDGGIPSLDRSSDETPTPVDAPVRPDRGERLTDGQAFGLFAAWLVFRAITQRFGLGLGPKLIASKPWLIPLLNNSFLLLLQAGTGTNGRPGMFVATMLTSMFMSTISGLVLYWAGWRFGHRLAEMAQRPGSPWAGIWNPKQIARTERWMESWGMAIIVVGRITEIFYQAIPLVAGASEMRLRRFVVANTIGAAGFAGLWLWLGGRAQERWPGLQPWLENTYGPWALRIGLGLIVLLVLIFALGSKLDKSKKKHGDGDTEPAEPAVEPGDAS
jgi:membrane protein DedA with SNARE-associated domain